jgi:hypothetical protein
MKQPGNPIRVNQTYSSPRQLHHRLLTYMPSTFPSRPSKGPHSHQTRRDRYTHLVHLQLWGTWTSSTHQDHSHLTWCTGHLSRSSFPTYNSSYTSSDIIPSPPSLQPSIQPFYIQITFSAQPSIMQLSVVVSNSVIFNLKFISVYSAVPLTFRFQ